MAGGQGHWSRQGWRSAWALWGHSASPGRAYFSRRRVAVKKDVGCRARKGTGVGRRLKNEFSHCGPGRACGSCPFSQLQDGKMLTQLYLLVMMQAFSNYGIYLQEKNYFPGTINLTKSVFFWRLT